MSRAISIARFAALEGQLNEANVKVVEANAAKDAAMRHAADLARKVDALTAERNAERDKVSSLKELLHNAEVSAGRLQGQLDRVAAVEAVAMAPVETRTVTERLTRPSEIIDNNVTWRGSTYGEKQKHWTSF